MNVRPAKLTDLDWLMSQLRTFSKFYGTKRMLFSSDEAQNRRVVSAMVVNDVFLVCEDDKGPVGFVSGFLVPHAFNPTLRLLSENFWWVCEGRRGSRAARLLLDAFIEEGRKRADWVDFGIVVGKTKANDRTFINRGFALKEKRFLMEV